MSKSLPLLFLLSLLGLSACEKDEPGEYVLTESDFVGSWDVREFSGDFRVTGTFSGNPINEKGISAISDSDLMIFLEDDGRWTSSGAYTMTVETDSDRQQYRDQGIGSGKWSYRDGSLLLSGLRNPNGTGYFTDPQSCLVLDFVQQRQISLLTEMDVTESDADYGISMRTQGDFMLQLVR
ncbi:hypothetical protein GGR26_001763 [Lewinella marina]|uniref:Lipocalin-like domain-containing protein n=1 Tax=Neolewinella marina TaxID=438751 RepID=A0A2G0CDP0_9BACT|nr:hypothetical protein [Neolewinella marina]NJB85995.1 hypothetical protein [Neolewinella marina]PHK98037.1 hypothetical protein CGL56_12665 [Neolewinella marina]